jgi:hypothetical protein
MRNVLKNFYFSNNIIHTPPEHPSFLPSSPLKLPNIFLEFYGVKALVASLLFQFKRHPPHKTLFAKKEERSSTMQHFFVFKSVCHLSTARI